MKQKTAWYMQWGVMHCHETKDGMIHAVGVMRLKDQGRPILQQMELLGSLFPLAHQAYFLHGYAFNRTMSMCDSLVTTTQYGIWRQHSPWHSKCFGEEAFVSTFGGLLHTCYSQRVLWPHCIFAMNSWYIIQTLQTLLKFLSPRLPNSPGDT